MPSFCRPPWCARSRTAAPPPTQRLAAIDLQGDIHENQERLLKLPRPHRRRAVRPGRSDAPRRRAQGARLSAARHARSSRSAGAWCACTSRSSRCASCATSSSSTTGRSSTTRSSATCRCAPASRCRPTPSCARASTKRRRRCASTSSTRATSRPRPASSRTSPWSGLPSPPARAVDRSRRHRQPRPVVQARRASIPTYDHDDGEKHLPRTQLYDIFHHWLRFKVSQMRDDARTAEKVLRDDGFPAARVVPDFDFARDADRKTHRVRLPVRVSDQAQGRGQVRRQPRHRRARSARPAHHLLRRRLRRRRARRERPRAAARVPEARLLRGARHLPPRAAPRARRRRRQAQATTSRRSPSPSTRGPSSRCSSVEIVSESGAPLTFAAADLRDKAASRPRRSPRSAPSASARAATSRSCSCSRTPIASPTCYKPRGFPAVKVRYEVARDPAAFDALGAFGAEVTGAGGGHDLYVRFFVDEGRREIVDHVELVVRRRARQERARRLHGGAARRRPAVHRRRRRATTASASSSSTRASGAPVRHGRPARGRRGTRRTIASSCATSSPKGPEVRFGEILIRGNFKTHGIDHPQGPAVHAGRSLRRHQARSGRAQSADAPHLQLARACRRRVQPGRNVAPVLVTCRSATSRPTARSPSPSASPPIACPTTRTSRRATCGRTSSATARSSSCAATSRFAGGAARQPDHDGRVVALHRHARVRPGLALRPHRLRAPGGDRPLRPRSSPSAARPA